MCIGAHAIRHFKKPIDGRTIKLADTQYVATGEMQKAVLLPDFADDTSSRVSTRR
jgi:hypothetical protein